MGDRAGACIYRGCMTLSRKINHDAILAGLFLLSVLILTVANCVSFIRTGTVTGANTLWTLYAVAGTIWFGRKL